MPPSPLPGRPGNCIKNRLESAAIRLKQVHSWEDLRLYLIQDDKWSWDDAIVLDWQQDIIDYFLECCKDSQYDDATIREFATALQDGQQLVTDVEVRGIGGSLEENSDRATVRPRHHAETPRSRRMIFHVSNQDKLRYEGLNVGHHDAPMSRVSEEIIKKRWDMEESIYPALVHDEYGGAQKSLVVDLTWELESGGKTRVTTFEVVPDKSLEHDAEFGQNKNDLPFSRQQAQAKGHSVSKSESAVGTSQKQKSAAVRTNPGAKSTTSSHRRQTIPPSSSRIGDVNRSDFVLEQLVKGLNINANLEYDRRQQALLEADEQDEEQDDEDEVFEVPGPGHAHRTPDTSVSARKSDSAGQRRK